MIPKITAALAFLTGLVLTATMSAPLAGAQALPLGTISVLGPAGCPILAARKLQPSNTLQKRQGWDSTDVDAYSCEK
jgi:hypothetical protein